MPRADAIQATAAILTANGFELKHASAVTGIIQAEKIDGSFLYQWFGTFTGDSIIQRATVKQVPNGKVLEVDFNRIGYTDSLQFLPAVDRIQALCNSHKQP
jgi:hypothetical protein